MNKWLFMMLKKLMNCHEAAAVLDLSDSEYR